MTPSSALLYGIGVFLGGGAFTEIATEGTWKDFVAGGAAAAVIFVVVVFLRHITSIEAQHTETTKALTENHAKATQALADAQVKTSADFSATVTRIATEAREAHETAIKTIVDVLQTKK